MIQTTDEVVTLTQLALEKTGGKVKDAAALLGISPKSLHSRIDSNAILRNRWRGGNKTVKPPSEAITLHRDPIIESPEESVLKSEQEIAAALEREDRSVRNGMSGMGLSPQEIDLSVQCQQFQRKHFRSAIETVGGGVVRQFIKVMAAVDAIEKELNDYTEPLSMEREQMLREDRSRLLVIMGMFKDKVDKSVLIQAQVSKLMKEREDKNANYKPKGVLDLESAAS